MSPFELRMKKAMAAIQGVKIPEMPEEVIQLDMEINSKFANAASVASIIEKNTTLSGAVMKLANSPVARTKQEVRSIREAVDVLGMEKLYSYVVTAALCNMFSGKKLLKDIMDNSVDVAFCMADLAEWVDGVSRNEAYMLGLFHNVGALMLASKNESTYESYYTASMSNPIKVVRDEELAYGTNHTMVGAIIGRKWKLSADMIQAIMFHHNQSLATIKSDHVRALVAMLKISNMIVAEISIGSYQGEEAKSYLADGVDELMLDSEVVNEQRTALMSYSFKG